MATIAVAQSERSQVTFSGGEAVEVGRFGGATAVSLGGSYSFRVLRLLGIEAGVLTALDPTGILRGANYSFDAKDRFTWVQFGPRLILPLWDGRMEVSAGAGGAYENYSIGNASGFLLPRSGWGGNLSAGAAVALDHRGHLWLGMTPRWFLVNAGEAHDRWFIAAGECGFRF